LSFRLCDLNVLCGSSRSALAHQIDLAANGIRPPHIKALAPPHLDFSSPAPMLTTFAVSMGPGGIVMGPDVNLCFVENEGSGVRAQAIGRITPWARMATFGSPSGRATTSGISRPDQR
jgi:hypothetical protein